MEKERVRGLLAGARKVIGLKPINRRHVEQMDRRLEDVEGETRDEREKRAKYDAVILFFKEEMRMRDEEIEKLDIVRIFSPAREDGETLYVELASWEMAQFALSYTKYMRRSTEGQDRVEVVKYVPRDLYRRFRAINALGHQARLDSNRSINFRVTLGEDDFVLQQKPRGRLGWGPPLPLSADLPAFEHHLTRGPRSPGKAPGRPTLTPRKETIVIEQLEAARN